MTVTEKIQGYLFKLELNHEQVDDQTWIVHDEEAGLSQLVVYAEEPLVVMRVKVMPLPQHERPQLFEALLRLNATGLVHGAYGLENENIVLIDTLEAQTMDFEEFQASVEALGLALAQHYPLLAKYMAK